MSTTTRRFLFLTALLIALSAVDAKPFFDAIYDAINGNGRRSYGYNGYRSGYGGYNTGYGSYDGYEGYEAPSRDRGSRKGKSWSDICRAHYPSSDAVPGTGGIVCPY